MIRSKRGRETLGVIKGTATVSRRKVFSLRWFGGGRGPLEPGPTMSNEFRAIRENGRRNNWAGPASSTLKKLGEQKASRLATPRFLFRRMFLVHDALYRRGRLRSHAPLGEILLDFTLPSWRAERSPTERFRGKKLIDENGEEMETSRSDGWIEELWG